MKKNLTLVIATLILTLSSFTALAVNSSKSQFSITGKKPSALMGITKGDNIDKAAEELQAFNSDISLRKLSNGYRGSIYLHGAEYEILLIPNRNNQNISLLSIRSPQYDVQSESTLTNVYYMYNLLRTAFVLLLGDPESEFVSIENDDPNNNKIALVYPEHGIVYTADIVKANGEAYISSSWEKDYTIQLAGIKEENMVQICVFIEYD